MINLPLQCIDKGLALSFSIVLSRSLSGTFRNTARSFLQRKVFPSVEKAWELLLELLWALVYRLETPSLLQQKLTLT